jgi:hypothetical protein
MTNSKHPTVTSTPIGKFQGFTTLCRIAKGETNWQG